VRAFFLVAAALIIGCSDPADTQYLPIGSRCASAAQCGTMPFDCSFSDGNLGGYCTKPCTTDGDCPPDALCHLHLCRRRCMNDSECRQSEGYFCAPLPAIPAACEPRPAAMDLGPPSG
jgi:hypothetical protein